MKVKLCSLFAVAGLSFSSGIPYGVQGQDRDKAASLESITQRALAYFERGCGDLSDCVRRIRPAGISAEQRARLIGSIRKEDIVTPSPERQAKLDALSSILEYHERRAVPVKILRLGLAWAGFLESAAIVVSEEGVDILTAEELQAVVAHELGHEYFAAEYDAARQRNEYDTVKEIELRCDAVSIITMTSLRLNPGALMFAVAKLTKFNNSRMVGSDPNLAPPIDDRRIFCREMIEFAESRRRNQATRC